MPKLSVITINLNDKHGLEQTINSVLSQSFKDYEYVVIDGASSDGSKEVLQHYSPQLHYSCSEPDHGIYDAMNKGIQHASGEYLLFLNSGDYLSSPEILDAFFRHSFQQDIVSGDVILKNAQGKTQSRSSVSEEELSIITFMKSSLWHQATLIRREFMNKIGCYRTDLRFVSDWAFFVDALYRNAATYKHVPVPLSVYLMAGATCDPKNLPRLHAEREKVWLEYFPRLHKDFKKLMRLEVLDHLPGIRVLLKLYPVYQKVRRVMDKAKYN